MQKGIMQAMRSDRAQGMVEYILIVALIALVAVAGVRMFGEKIMGLFAGQADKIGQEVGEE